MISGGSEKIGDLVEILSGAPFESERFGDEGDLPLIRIRDVVPGKSSTYYTGDYDPKYLVADGDVLVGMDGDFNRARWHGGKALLNQRVCKIVVSSPLLDEKYLYHFLPAALKAIWDNTPFVTVKHLSVKDIRSIEIPLPSINVQRRIADILDRADALRAKRRAALARLDELTQAIFIEMFGDGGEDNTRWPIRNISDFVAGFEGGKSLEADSEEDSRCVHRILKISAVTGMFYRPEESKPLPVSYIPPKAHHAKQGDLLFSRANTSELVGAVAYVWETPANLVLPDKLWRFVWKDQNVADPLFVWALFQTDAVRHEIVRRATGTSGSMKNIGQKKVMGIRTILPPYQLQKRFSDQVRHIRQLQNVGRNAMENHDSLFASLQDRAFRGAL